MDASGHKLVPAGSDDSIICEGVYPANTDFEMFVVLVSEVEPGSSMVLEVEELPWFFEEFCWFLSELDVLNVGRDCQELREVRAAPVVYQCDSFRVGGSQEVFGDAPGDESDCVSVGLFRLVPEVDEQADGEERCKNDYARLLHFAHHCEPKGGGWKRFSARGLGLGGRRVAYT